MTDERMQQKHIPIVNTDLWAEIDGILDGFSDAQSDHYYIAWVNDDDDSWPERVQTNMDQWLVLDTIDGDRFRFDFASKTYRCSERESWLSHITIVRNPR